MPREIKFRAWDKGEGFTYFNVVEGLFGEDRNHNEAEEKMIETIQQYTGLKDKNGKEIYEGDVFNCLYHFDGCVEHRMVVEWVENRAAFFPRWDYKKCQQKEVTKTMNDLTRLEIVGNIYENPEFLNEKKK